MILSSFFTIIILTTIQDSFCYFSGYQIAELTTNDAIFTSEALNYVTTTLVTPGTPFSQCGGIYILGGYDILATAAEMGFTRSFSNLPSHNKIHLSFTLFMLDSLSQEDYFQVNVDSRSFQTWQTHLNNWGTGDICGSTSFNDYPNLRIFIQAVHSSSTLNLQFLSYADEVSTNEAYGFRDVRVLFVNTSISVSETLCTNPGIDIPSSFTCGGCFEGQYYDTSSGDCLHCNEACTSCFGPRAEDCFQCEAGFGWSGTECVKCDPSCNGCHGPTSADCEACAPGQSLWIFSSATFQPYTPKYCADTTYCADPLTFSLWHVS